MRCPSEDFSATWQRERVSEREMKSALNTDLQRKWEGSCYQPCSGSQEFVSQTRMKKDSTAVSRISCDLRVKPEFNQFRSFVFGFLPLPIADRILRRLYQ